MFYTFDQNNSGGDWSYDKKAGISHIVVIEAVSPEDACDKAEAIGLYFDGCDSGQDCDCRGDRWSRPDEKGTEAPSNYGRPIIVGQSFAEAHKDEKYSRKWMKGKPEGFVHYLDGRVEGFWS